MKYPILYARSSTNAILEWQIEQDNNQYRTISGQQNGKKVISEFTTCYGKNIGKSNETSDKEQCEAEIAAKYVKQIKADYKENIDDIDISTFFSPQLAKQYSEHKDKIDWNKGCYISPKLDGVRFVLNKNGAFTRNGNQFLSVPHIVNGLKSLFVDDKQLTIDGELYASRLSNDFNKIISLAKKVKPTQEDWDESEKYLKYHIFDIPSIKGQFHERWPKIEKFFKDEIGRTCPKYTELVPHILVHSEKEVVDHLNKFILEGYEGIMINLYDGEYLQKRTSNLLKYKLFQDEEFEIVDIIEGDGNRAGMFGRATLKMKNGNVFDSNARGNQAFYIDLLKNKSNYIGQLATVRYQNLTPDGIPRFPVIVSIRNFE